MTERYLRGTKNIAFGRGKMASQFAWATSWDVGFPLVATLAEDDELGHSFSIAKILEIMKNEFKAIKLSLLWLIGITPLPLVHLLESTL